MARPIPFEEGWEIIRKGIVKLENPPEGLEPYFTSDEYMNLYTIVYNMCNQNLRTDYRQHSDLYDKLKEYFNDYFNLTVLPSLKEKCGELMLRELVKRWANYKLMDKWLLRIFDSLDRWFINRWSLPTIKKVGLIRFRRLVYRKINGKVTDVVVSLIDREREGEQIDRVLLKNVLDIFVEIGMGKMDYYKNDFEAGMLEDTAAYYSHKASNWFRKNSIPDYMFRVEECLKQEKDRVSHYLHSSSEQSLLEKVEDELLSAYTSQLLEKEQSGDALLGDEDLSRMYRLFREIPYGLYFVSQFFKQQVIAEGTALVNQAECEANVKKAKERDIVGLKIVAKLEEDNVGFEVQVFLRRLFGLLDKNLEYAENCFMNHPLLHKALREAFDVFLNSSEEFVAIFCDKKVVQLLASRPLCDKSSNYDHERIILTKIKQQYCEQFTIKMEGMIEDLALAKENQTNFEKYLKGNPHANPGIDLPLTVPRTAYWPRYKSFDLILPAEMAKGIEVSREFDKTNTEHGNHTWIYLLGTWNINGNLIVTTYQMLL